MQGPEYIFAFKRSATEFYGLDSNGQLHWGTNPYFFSYSPAGWENISISRIRNRHYWGIDRTTSLSITYVEDAAKILKSLVLKYGTEVPISLLVCKQQLKFIPTPAGTLVFTDGGNSMPSNGHTRGTITGPVGSTVFLTISIQNAQPGDLIQGNIGSLIYVNQTIGSTSAMTWTIPIVNDIPIPFNLYFNNLSGGSSASVNLSNQDGTISSGYGFYYKVSFNGDVDTTDFMHAGAKVTARSLEEGIAKYLKANEATEYEFPMNVPDVGYVKMDGITLHNIVETFVSDGTYTIDANEYKGNHIINTEKTKSDAPFLAGTKSTFRTKVSNLNSQIRATKEWFLKSTVESDVLVTYDFTVILNYFAPPAPNPAAIFKIVIRRIGEDNLSDFQSELLSVSSIGFNGTYHVVGSKVITARAGDELYFYAYCNVEGSTGDAQLQVNYDINAANSFFNYDYKYRHLTSYIPFFRNQYLFSELVKNVTDSTFQALISDFLLQDRTVVWTCGNAIRGIKNTDGTEAAVMKISLKTFFDFYDSRSTVALKYSRNTIDLIHRITSISNVVVRRLPQPSYPPKVRIATEFLFNEIDYGSPEIKNEVGVLNGNEEFNCKWSRSLGATKKPSKINKVTSVNTSCYKIEGLRIQTFQKDTTDNKSDNELFALAIGNTLIPGNGADIPDHYELDRTLNSTATGLIEPNSVFNIALSPARALNGMLPWLNSCMLHGDGMVLKYSNCDKNNKLSAGGITEKDDVTLGSSGAKLFHPIIIEVEVPAPDDLIAQDDAGQLIIYEVEINGHYFRGIELENTINEVTRKTNTFSLLATADNNFEKLIEYAG